VKSRSRKRTASWCDTSLIPVRRWSSVAEV